MKDSLLVPSRSGSASQKGAWSTVKPGSKSASSSAAGRMNMLRVKSECQADSLTTRTGRR